MNVQEALIFGRRMLKRHKCGGSDPEREPADLLAHAMKTDHERLLADPDAVLEDAAADAYARFLQRRLRHEPLAQIIGHAPFLGRDFTVTRATLVPRPATEAITDIAVRAFAAGDAGTAIDVGTGCGCVAISLAGAKPSAKVVATDISAEALKVARENAQKLGLNDHVDFRVGDLLLPAADDLQALEKAVLVANLPYIPEGSMANLAPDVFAYEPGIALFGGADGLDPYRRLLDQLALYAESKEVHMYVEIFPEQFAVLVDEIGARFPGSEVADISVSGTVIGAVARLATGAKDD